MFLYGTSMRGDEASKVMVGHCGVGTPDMLKDYIAISTVDIRILKSKRNDGCKYETKQLFRSTDIDGCPQHHFCNLMFSSLQTQGHMNQDKLTAASLNSRCLCAPSMLRQACQPCLH
jgi:hypothetical protein